MYIKQTKIWKLLSSVKLAIWLFSIIAGLSLLGTVIVQNEEPEFYINRFGHLGYSALQRTGLSDMYNSWWFILLLILFSLNLTACILNRVSINPVRDNRRLKSAAFSNGVKKGSLGTFICHISVLVILFGALVGMLFGQRGYVKINKTEEVNYFEDRAKHVNLGFAVRLDDFIYNESLKPKERLLVYSKGTNDFCQMHDKAGKVRSQPIASISTEIGEEEEIADTGYRIKILDYVPDFVMDVATKQVSTRTMKANNPAIEIELKSKDGVKDAFWVFARYPDIHQSKASNFNFIYNWVARQPKDFISKVTIIKDNREILNRDIKVNFPLKFSGFSFFQSSYDPEQLNWTGLRVVKDPGVGIVYLGFGLLILGLCIRFYVNLFLKTLENN